MSEKYYPSIGDKLYLSQRTGRYYIDAVKRPYTVIGVTASTVVIQSCKYIWPIFHYDPETMSEYYKDFDGKETRFYDTIPEKILPDDDGEIKILHWSNKHEKWQIDEFHTGYPEFATFTKEYEFYPYLD